MSNISNYFGKYKSEKKDMRPGLKGANVCDGLIDLFKVEDKRIPICPICTSQDGCIITARVRSTTGR